MTNSTVNKLAKKLVSEINVLVKFRKVGNRKKLSVSFANDPFEVYRAIYFSIS